MSLTGSTCGRSMSSLDPSEDEKKIVLTIPVTSDTCEVTPADQSAGAHSRVEAEGAESSPPRPPRSRNRVDKRQESVPCTSTGTTAGPCSDVPQRCSEQAVSGVDLPAHSTRALNSSRIRGVEERRMEARLVKDPGPLLTNAVIHGAVAGVRLRFSALPTGPVKNSEGFKIIAGN